MRLRDCAGHDGFLARADHDRRRRGGFCADNARQRRFGRLGDDKLDQAGIDHFPPHDPVIQAGEHVARLCHGFCRALNLHPVAARGDIHPQPVFDQQQVAVEFAEQLHHQLRAIKGQLGAAAIARLGGDGLTAHAVPWVWMAAERLGCGADGSAAAIRASGAEEGRANCIRSR